VSGWRPSALEARRRAGGSPLPAGTARARFRSWCPACGALVSRGDVVARDLLHGWVHAACADPSQIGGSAEDRRDARRAADRRT